MMPSDNGKPQYWWFLPLLLPFVGLLCVPAYNHIAPALWGIPFFFWYQFLWVLISATITAIVYVKSEPHRTKPPLAASDQPNRQRG